MPSLLFSLMPSLLFSYAVTTLFSYAVTTLLLCRHYSFLLCHHYSPLMPSLLFSLTIFSPLTSEMVHYAREDTHYLLYIYERLTNELITQGNASGNLIRAVYTRSRDICATRYENDLYTPGLADALYAKHSRNLSSSQLLMFKVNNAHDL